MHSDTKKISTVPAILRNMGIRGSLLSLYHSWKHTGKPVSFIFGKKTRSDISSTSTIDIDEVFVLGANKRNIGNSAVAGQYIHIKDGATFTARGMARIGAGSELDIWGDFSMGDSYIAGHSRIFCHKSISIGDDCAISWNVDILDDDSHQLIIDGDMKEKRQPIDIKDHVWIGHGCTITKGVTIGEGAVIAAKSTVTKDIPPYCLAAGTPAKVIEENVEWQ